MITAVITLVFACSGLLSGLNTLRKVQATTASKEPVRGDPGLEKALAEATVDVTQCARGLVLRSLFIIAVSFLVISATHKSTDPVILFIGPLIAFAGIIYLRSYALDLFNAARVWQKALYRSRVR